MFIDIYEQPELAYASRKAIEKVVLKPTVDTVPITHFNFGDLTNASIILDQTTKINPKRIQYIILDEDGDKTHWYVTGYNFVQGGRYELTLLSNPWPFVSKQKKAYIKRSKYPPHPIQDFRPESGLTFNKQKQSETLIEDEYGSHAKWGLLFLAKTTSAVQDKGGVTVQLSSINYTIEGTSLPKAPGDVKIEGGNKYAYFFDGHPTNDPVPNNPIELGTGYTYTRSTAAPAAPVLPSNMDTRFVSTSNNSMTFAPTSFTIQSRIIGGRTRASSGIGWTDPHFVERYDGSWLATVNADGSVSIAAGTGSKYGTGGLYPIGGSITQERLDGLVAGRVAIVDDSTFYEQPTRGAANPATWDFPAVTVPAGSVSAAPFPAWNDEQPLVNGGYKVGTQTFYYEFTNQPEDVITPSIAGGKLIPTTRNISIKGGSFRQVYNFPTNTNWRASQTRVRQIANKKYELFDYSVIRKIYSNSTLNHVTNKVTLSTLTNTSAPIPLPDNSEVTFRKFLIEDATAAAFVGLGNFTSFNYTANLDNTHFSNNVLEEEFVANNVHYIYNREVLTQGYYRVTTDGREEVVKMTPTTVTRDVVANFSFTVNINGFTSSSVADGTTFMVTSQTGLKQISPAAVTLQLSMIGETEVIPYDIDYKITVDNIDNATIWTEPYAILAVPLFPVRYKLKGGQIRQNNLDQTQRIFHDFIRTYSGTRQIVCAQYSPYAPHDFKIPGVVNEVTGERSGVLFKDVSGVYMDLSDVDVVGTKQDGSEADSMPFVVLHNANTRFSFFADTNPDNDKRKEYTLRNMRLCSPNFDSQFQFNYYDFNNTKHDNGGRGDLRIDVSITFKPFGTFLHACPFTHPNTLMGSQDWDDLRGLVCGPAIFECSMTSSAYETYKRENTMYDQIQARTVESMEINFRAERENEKWSSFARTLGSATSGGSAGAAAGSFGGPIGTAVGFVAGGIVGGITSGAASAAQRKLNEELRQREASDQKFYYDANLQNIMQQPDALNRVSSYNLKIQDRFAIILEVWGPTKDEPKVYDDQVAAFGKSINAMDTLDKHLKTGNYIEGYLPYSDEPKHIHDRINDDLQKGVYYYEQV